MRRLPLLLLLEVAALAFAVTVFYVSDPAVSTGAYSLTRTASIPIVGGPRVSYAVDAVTLGATQVTFLIDAVSGYEGAVITPEPSQPPEQPPPSQPPSQPPPGQPPPSLPPPSQPPEEQPPEQPEQPPERPTEEPWYKRAWRGFIELLQRLLQYARGYPWLLLLLAAGAALAAGYAYRRRAVIVIKGPRLRR